MLSISAYKRCGFLSEIKLYAQTAKACLARIKTIVRLPFFARIVPKQQRVDVLYLLIFYITLKFAVRYLTNPDYCDIIL